MWRIRLKLFALALGNLAARIVRLVARRALRHRRTTTAGITGALAYFATRYNFVLPTWMQPYIIPAAFLLLGALAADGQRKPKGQL